MFQFDVYSRLEINILVVYFLSRKHLFYMLETLVSDYESSKLPVNNNNNKKHTFISVLECVK